MIKVFLLDFLLPSQTVDAKKKLAGVTADAEIKVACVESSYMSRLSQIISLRASLPARNFTVPISDRAGSFGFIFYSSSASYTNCSAS